MGEPSMFPIQSEQGAKPHPIRIPWSVAELAYSVYSARYGRSQSLARLAERGGFGPGEMDEYLPDWRERCDENATLRRSNTTLLNACEPITARYKVAIANPSIGDFGILITMAELAAIEDAVAAAKGADRG